MIQEIDIRELAAQPRAETKKSSEQVKKRNKKRKRKKQKEKTPIHPKETTSSVSPAHSEKKPIELLPNEELLIPLSVQWPVRSQSDTEDPPQTETAERNTQRQDRHNRVQTSLHKWTGPLPTKPNELWGTSIHEKEKGVIRFAQQNIRGIKFTPDGLNFGKVFSDIKNMAVDVSMIIETNLEWKEKEVLSTAKDAANAVFGTARIITSSSETAWEGSWKPGGTMMCVVEDSIGRILEEGQDIWGLGRWTRIRMIGQGGKFLVVYGAYRVPVNNDPGPSTAQFQQQLLLMAMKNLSGSTDPRKRFIDDLIQSINDDRAEGNEIIVVLDANAVITEDRDGLDRLIRECGLCNLAQFIPNHHEPPGTYEHSG